MFVSPYLLHIFQFFLEVQDLPGFKPKGCEHQEEQHQHDHDKAAADPHAATALAAAPHGLMGRREWPAGNEVWRRPRLTLTSAFVHQEHLRERVPLVKAHGAGPDRATSRLLWTERGVDLCLRCSFSGWTQEVVRAFTTHYSLPQKVLKRLSKLNLPKLSCHSLTYSAFFGFDAWSLSN